MINTEIREILINFNYRIMINNLKINFFNTNNYKFLLSNISIKFRFILFTSLIIITGLLIINTSPNQLIQAQGNNNFNSNNDISKSIEQGVTNQLNNAFSNTPLGSGNPATQSSNNNIATQSSNNNIATQSSNNNIATQSSNNNIATQSSNNNIATQSSNNNIATQSSNNNNPNVQENNPIGNNFLISGPLSSFLSTPTGNWVINGSWILKVQNGNVSFFTVYIQCEPTNLTKIQQINNFANFRALPDTQSISLGPNRVIDIKGVMDIGANNKIEWVNVPSEIKTAGNTITVLILDDAKTGNHFNNYPIFGKISHLEKCSDNGGFGANMDYDPSIVKCSS